MLLVVLSVTATVTALASGAPLGIALTGACAIDVLSVLLRLSDALKGPLPPALLTPVNTPAGDLRIVMQIGGASSGTLTAILGALTVTMLPVTPLPLALVVIWTSRTHRGSMEESKVHPVGHTQTPSEIDIGAI